ncbi:MAG: phosphate-selective porin [Paracoccaceae bacterium]|jgi:phosphate-selective porin
MKKTHLALALAVVAPVAFAAPSTEEMWNTIQLQQQEIEQLKARTAQTDAKVEATASAFENNGSDWMSSTTIGGYGEHHFNHFEDKADQVDAHRYVLFVGHQFNDSLRFFSELEVEHGLVKDTADGSGPGEVELEQAFIQWDFMPNHSLTMGQFLIPVGIINETHEPDSFYGTERNTVEAAIVPATWWESGAMVSGEIMPGLSYNLAVHSGLKTSDAGTVRGGRQKSAKATAEDLAYSARLRYAGVAGLELAATVQQQQDITQGAGVGDNDATLLEAHARYTVGALTLTALIAEWDIDGSNFDAAGRDQQDGMYVEASYKITPKLGVFVRQSEFDNNAGNSADTETKQFDVGVNYWLHERVVLKADIVNQDTPKSVGADNDGFNLGLGWSF